MTLVKICGIRSLPEGRVALEAGANLLGFIFWEPGKRYIQPTDAAEIISTLRGESPDWSAVGVFVDPDPEEVEKIADVCCLDFIQLSGQEPREVIEAMPRPVLKALHVRSGDEARTAEMVMANTLSADRYLLDTHTTDLPGGTGKAFDWSALSAVGPRCVVAGGLTADNVTGALAALRPYGVDVSSGVEFPSGGKDPRLVRSFLEAVRAYDHRSN